MNATDLINAVRNYNGFASMTIAKTDIVKKSCPLANVTEMVQYSHIAIGTSYENAVNNRNERINGSRDFVAESLPWGQWEIINKVIVNKGNYYLRYYTDRKSNPTRTLFVNGRLATAAEVEIINAHRTKASGSSNRQAALNIAAEDQVKPRNAKFANILKIKFGDFAI
jgi:hypothetical protein